MVLQSRSHLAQMQLKTLVFNRFGHILHKVERLFMHFDLISDVRLIKQEPYLAPSFFIISR